MPSGTFPTNDSSLRATATEAAMRAAFTAGDPVFVQRANGSIIGLEPYTSTDAATMTCLAEGTWGDVLYPANEFVRVTDSASVMRCGLPLEFDGGYAHVDDIAFRRDGTITITDLVTGSVTHDQVTMIARGYDAPLADTWRRAFAQPRRQAEAMFPALDHGPQRVHVRTTTGSLYEFERNGAGKILFADITNADRGPRVHRRAGSITILQTNRISIETNPLGGLTDYITEITRCRDSGPRGPLGVEVHSAIAALTRPAEASRIPLPGPELG